MSQFVRRLIYRELQEPFPEGDLADLQALAVRVDQDWNKPAGLELFRELADRAATEDDPVRCNYARQILGDLAAMMHSEGLIAFPKLKKS